MDVMFRKRRDATEDEGGGGSSSVQHKTITYPIISPSEAEKTESGKRNAEEKKRKKKKKKWPGQRRGHLFSILHERALRFPSEIRLSISLTTPYCVLSGLPDSGVVSS